MDAAVIKEWGVIVGMILTSLTTAIVAYFQYKTATRQTKTEATVNSVVDRVEQVETVAAMTALRVTDPGDEYYAKENEGGGGQASGGSGEAPSGAIGEKAGSSEVRGFNADAGIVEVAGNPDYDKVTEGRP